MTFLTTRSIVFKMANVKFYLLRWKYLIWRESYCGKFNTREAAHVHSRKKRYIKIGPLLQKKNMTTVETLREKLFYWNVLVVFVHWSSFLALTIISFVNLDSARYVPLWIDFGSPTAIKSLGSYPIFSTLLPFPLITGAFHAWLAYNYKDYYSRFLVSGVAKARWLEFAITNGLMTFSVMVLARAGSILIPILGVFCNFQMQYFGYLHELRNHRVTPMHRTKGPYLMGFFPWIATWATIFTYYGLNVGNMVLSDSFAIIGTFVLSLTFVLPLEWRYTRANTIQNNYNTEVAYILLSLTAKLYLDWTVTIGTLVGN